MRSVKALPSQRDLYRPARIPPSPRDDLYRSMRVLGPRYRGTLLLNRKNPVSERSVCLPVTTEPISVIHLHIYRSISEPPPTTPSSRWNGHPTEHTAPSIPADPPTSPPAPGLKRRVQLMGREILSKRSRPKRADAQRLVTTRLLDHLHDPLAATRSSAEDPSPRALKWQSVDEVRRFLHRTHGQPVKVQGQRPIRIRLRRAGSNHHVPARILT